MSPRLFTPLYPLKVQHDATLKPNTKVEDKICNNIILLILLKFYVASSTPEIQR